MAASSKPVTVAHIRVTSTKSSTSADPGHLHKSSCKVHGVIQSRVKGRVLQGPFRFGGNGRVSRDVGNGVGSSSHFGCSTQRTVGQGGYEARPQRIQDPLNAGDYPKARLYFRRFVHVINRGSKDDHKNQA